MLIYVYKQNQFLGELEEENNNITFIYSKYIDKDYYIVSMKNTINKLDDLPLVFKNLLLENSDLINIKTPTKIEKLLLLQDTHGSYQFKKLKSNSHSKDKIHNYQDVKNEILENNYIFPNILDYKINISPERLNTTLPQNLKQLSKFSYIANPKKPSSFSDSILYFLDTHPLVFYISMFHGIFGDYKTQYNHLHPWLTH